MESELQIEEVFEVASAVDYTEDGNIGSDDAVDDDVLTDSEAARAVSKIVIAEAPCVREVGKQEKAMSDGIDQAAGNIDAAALTGDVEPDVVEVGFGARGYTVRHYPA